MNEFLDDLASQVGESIKSSLTKCNAHDSLGDQTVSISIEVKISKNSNKQVQFQAFFNESLASECWAYDPNTEQYVRVPCTW